MARTGSINVFFIPYEPKPSDRTEVTAVKPDTSWQRHASREYHRKNRLRKASAATRSRGRGSLHGDQCVHHARKILSRTDKDATTEPGPSSAYQIIDKIGRGELDPFGVAVRSGTSKYAIQMLHHAIDQQWPGFDAGTGPNKIKQAILSCAMASPASFYAIVFAAATHNAFAYTATNVPLQNKMLRLSYKGLALSHLRQEITHFTGPASEELLLCMVVLAAHGHGDTLSPPSSEKGRMKGQLALSQHSQFYGEMRWESAHMDALASLIVARGGLHTITLPGLAETIRLSDNLQSFRKISKPVFPLLEPIENVLSGRSWDALRVRSRNGRTLPGIRGLPATVTMHSLIQAMQRTQLITAGYEAFLARNEAAPSLVQLLSGRNSILHEVLSLDPRVRSAGSGDSFASSDLSLPSFRPHNPVYTWDVSEAVDEALLTLIRLSTLAFILLVLFPMPRAAGIHDKLSVELVQALTRCKDRGLWEEFADLLVWGTVLGGATASGESRTYFEETWLSWENGVAVREDWNDDVTLEAELWRTTRIVCGNFLWHDGPESELQQQVAIFWDHLLERRKQAAVSFES